MLEYFKVYLKYFIIIIITAIGIKTIVNVEICHQFTYDFLLDALICGGVVNVIFYLVFRKTEEFQYFADLVKQIFKKIIRR